MPKSKDAFRTISEVADWLETPAHVLRFWESKFTHVKPVKRAGGRRYYRPADMKLLGGIKKLLHDDGLTIKGAQKLLREHGVKHVAALSQPLDEDLLDEEDLIEEAAYEPDAQAEPLAEPEVKVLSFPTRPETPESAAAAPEPEAPQDIETPEIAETASAQIEDPVEETPESLPESVATAPETPVVEELDVEETPAFGGDALPAFMRRAPAASPPEDTQVDEVAEAAPAQEEQPAKLTISPVARFEPVDAAEEPSEAVEEQAPVEEAKPANPIFSHRMPQETPSEPSAPVADVASVPESEPETAVEVEAEPTPASITYDVPSVAKVAPPLDSYDAPAGVLSTMQGTRRIAPELAMDLGIQLDALRELRTRMQNH